MLQNAYLLAKIGFDTAENGPHRFQKSGDWDTVQAGTPPGRDHPMGGWLQRLCPRSVACWEDGGQAGPAAAAAGATAGARLTGGGWCRY